MKRNLTRILLLLLLIPALTLPALGAGETFADVPPDAYYAEAVDWALTREITFGTAPDTFSPNLGCTRGQVVSFLWRAEGRPEPETADCPFADVGERAYYRDAVLWAADYDITAGTAPDAFSPGAVCTRAQIVTFLWRYAGRETPMEPGGFSDVAETAYYAEAVGWALENGITAGISATEFGPNRTCTRAQVVTFLYRLDQYLSGGDDDDDGEDDEPEDYIDTIHVTEPEPEHIRTGTLTAEDGETYTGDYVDNQLIVNLSPDCGEEDLWDLLEDRDGFEVGWMDTVGIYQLEFSEAMTPEELRSLAEELEQDPRVDTACLNTMITLDYAALAYPDDPWGTEDTAGLWQESVPAGYNWGYEAINAATARQTVLERWKKTGEPVPRARVAVIDGMFFPHEDLDFEQIFYGDRKVRKDPGARSYAVSQINDWDEYGGACHGNHVAGIIAARQGNGVGVSGVAINPRLVGYALDNKDGAITGFEAQTVVGTLLEHYGKDAPVVFNLSVATNTGGTAEDQKTRNVDAAYHMGKTLEDYLNQGYDFLMVTAAGNGESQLPNRDARYANMFTAVNQALYPEVYDRILVVGANNSAFRFEQDFTHGARIDVSAPGAMIYSTAHANGALEPGKEVRYLTQGGTSMASPQAAGLAALLLELEPDLDGKALKKTIVDTANIRLANGDSENRRHNMINAAYAVSSVLGQTYTVTESEACRAGGVTWTLDTEGNLRIHSTGNITREEDGKTTLIQDYPSLLGARIGSTFDWYRWRHNIKTLTIEEGVRELERGDFSEYPELETVVLPASLTRLGEEVFLGCDKLESVTIPKTCSQIWTRALGYDTDGNRTKYLTIYGWKDSTAEEYAKANDIPFVYLDKEGELTIRVTSSRTGQPLPGEELTLTLPDGTVSTRTTDAGGTVTLFYTMGQEIRYRMEVPGYEIAAGTIRKDSLDEDGGLTHHIALKPFTQDVKLTVLDRENGLPLEGAQVVLYGAESPEGPWTELYTDDTDRNGRISYVCRDLVFYMKAEVSLADYETETPGPVAVDGGGWTETVNLTPENLIPEGFIPIYSLEDFQALNGTESAILMTDLTISGPQKLTAWAGILEGNGHTIRVSGCPMDGLVYGGGAGGSRKVYAWLGYNSGTIRNTKFTLNMTHQEERYSASYLRGGSFSGSSGEVEIALIAENQGTIENCVFTGEINSFSYGTVLSGGVTAQNSGTIDNCVSFVNVENSVCGYQYNGGEWGPGSLRATPGIAWTGGIAGRNQGTIKDCLNGDTVMAEHYLQITGSDALHVGGITGANQSAAAEIRGCCNACPVYEQYADTDHEILPGNAVQGTCYSTRNAADLVEKVSLDWVKQHWAFAFG